MVTLHDVHRAREIIAEQLRPTPLFDTDHLSERIGARLLLKAESLQKTGAFKARGALNKIASLSQDERRRGVIAVSAGNHAQGVAWAATASGVKSTIVMASSASQTKIDATRGYGAEVVLVEGGIAGAFEQIDRLKEERGLVLVHPFNDPAIIAGQGTVGLEILDDAPETDVIVCPIGGGGLIAGIALAVKESKPGVRVYGVEPENADVMRRSWEAGKPVSMVPRTIADGLASPVAEQFSYDLNRKYVDEIVTVSDDEIIAALRDLLVYTKLYTEPAGAAATAALLTGKIPLDGDETVVSILSGGNFDLDKLKGIL